jgi:UDP-2,3-diacylglucosamine pyrophosphatase LpxH
MMHLTFLKDYLMKEAEVFLVARLKDNRLNYPGKYGCRIFFPDLHLIDKDRDAVYKYSTNEVDLLARVVKKVRDFKVASEQNNQPVTVYQLGDFMDLWRQNPVALTSSEATKILKDGLQKIREDRSEILSVLLGDELKTQVMLGNHDFDLHLVPEFAGSELRYFFPLSIDGPAAFTLHGDVFSVFERNMPVALKNLGVFLFGPGAKPSTEKLGEFRELKNKEHENSNYTNSIRQPDPANLAELLTIEEDKPGVEDYFEGDNFNIKKVGVSPEEDLTYVKESIEFAGMVNKQQNWNMRFAVIGHTHHARIAVDETNGGFFALVDCGAWIDNCEGSGLVMPNAQIGVLYDNEARIYQLKSKA